jgi:hypothetical protein
VPLAVSPTPAVLPIRQTSSRSRPAGIDLPIPASVPGIDAFHPPTPASTPMVPIAVPSPPTAPLELAAPVSPSFDPAVWGLDLTDLEAVPETGRRRGADEAEVARRSRRPPSDPSVPFSTRLLGKGKSGAARLLVLALVVGAEGVAVTSMGGTARTVTHDPSTAVTNAFEYAPAVAPAASAASASASLVQPPVQAQPTAAATQPGLLDPADALAFEVAQQSSSKAMVSAAVAQAQAAAARVKAAAQRRAQAMSSAQQDPKAAAQLLVADRGWSAGQFSCLVSLWNRESGWNYRAYNASSGAYGIPQALPGSKMGSIASDWRTNPVTQIRWGLSYISSRYGTPCGAWAHSQSTGWY